MDSWPTEDINFIEARAFAAYCRADGLTLPFRLPPHPTSCTFRSPLGLLLPASPIGPGCGRLFEDRVCFRRTAALYPRMCTHVTCTLYTFTYARTYGV